MTDEACIDFVWDRLGWRKHLLGRPLVSRMCTYAVQQTFAGCSEKAIASALGKPPYDNAKMGIIATILLGALLNQIVALVAEWVKRRRALYEQR